MCRQFGAYWFFQQNSYAIITELRYFNVREKDIPAAKGQGGSPSAIRKPMGCKVMKIDVGGKHK
jgi:hypothetical protein